MKTCIDFVNYCIDYYCDPTILLNYITGRMCILAINSLYMGL